ncbi:MAG: hypothetical protein LBC70_01650, partial [Chitinispirillales bacterium]|nr:hypothetical protein [Chitinispirillales bacterium]
MENDGIKTKRYEYLIAARNYHYTQYNVWMAFFITISGGLFVGYYSLLGNDGHSLEKGMVALLGYIVAFLFYCSSKGYHYWITNFATLINDYEQNTWLDKKDRVYFVIANKGSADECLNYFCPLKGANISTTKIVSLLAYLLTYAWGVLIASSFDSNYRVLLLGILVTLILNTLLTALLVKLLLRSSTSKHPGVKI